MRELDVDVTTTISTTQRKADKQAGHVFLQTHTDSEKGTAPGHGRPVGL